MDEKLSDKDYRAIDCESFSSIKYILDSPLEYYRQKATPFKGNSATDLGTAVHHYLQGNRHLVAVNPFKTTASPGFDEWKVEFIAKVGDEGIIITKSAEEKVNAIMTNFNANPFAIQLMEESEHEVPFFFEYNGVKMKGKVDGFTKGLKRVVEIKTTGSCEDAWSFKQNAVIAKHYDMQAYGYLTGLGFSNEQFELKEIKHYFISCLTKPPYSVTVYPLSVESFHRGENKLLRATSDYKRYIINKEEFTPEPILEEV